MIFESTTLNDFYESILEAFPGTESYIEEQLAEKKHAFYGEHRGAHKQLEMRDEFFMLAEIRHQLYNIYRKNTSGGSCSGGSDFLPMREIPLHAEESGHPPVEKESIGQEREFVPAHPRKHGLVLDDR